MQNHDKIRPAYYQMQIGKTKFDVFDLVRAIQKIRTFTFEEATALKYLVRLKEDTVPKRINDLMKAQECIRRQIEYLEGFQSGSATQSLVLVSVKKERLWYELTYNGQVADYVIYRAYIEDKEFWLIYGQENGVIFNLVQKDGHIYFGKLDNATHYKFSTLEEAKKYLLEYTSRGSKGTLKYNNQEFEAKEPSEIKLEPVCEVGKGLEIKTPNHISYSFNNVKYHIELGVIPSIRNYWRLYMTSESETQYLCDYALMENKFVFTARKDDPLQFETLENVLYVLRAYLEYIYFPQKFILVTP